MSDISRLTEWHKSQLGVRETGQNNVIYNTHYYGGEVSGERYPWCCTYIWDSFAQLGLSALFCGGQKTAYCPYVMDYAQRNGRWFEGDYREGDLLLFDWNGDGEADHIGYCLSWDGMNAETIEGNAGDAVSAQMRHEAQIMGAYRPEYGEIPSPLRGAPLDSKESRINEYTVQKGDTLWGIAEKFLGSGLKYKELMQLNNLASDNIYPGQVLMTAAGTESETVTISAIIKADTHAQLSRVANTQGVSIGEVIDSFFGGLPTK